MTVKGSSINYFRVTRGGVEIYVGGMSIFEYFPQK